MHKILLLVLFLVFSFGREEVWRDASTGLEWQVNISQDEYDWWGAKDYCKNLNYGGYSDWRTPTRAELKTIISSTPYHSKSNNGKVYIKEPLLDSVYYLKWPWFWSSEEKDSVNAWKAYLDKGNISDYKKTSTCSVRCVRGGKISVSEDIWKDRSTGLQWQVNIPKKEYDWWGAKDYCRNLNYGGYSDWRAPTRAELKTIISSTPYPSKSNNGHVYIKEPLLDSVYYLKWPWFWSSEEKDSVNAWKAYLDKGDISDYKKTSTCSIRCVRGNSNKLSSNSEKVWKDPATNYMWQVNIPKKEYNWWDAKDYCRNLNYGGYSDWKLPTKDELSTIISSNSYPSKSTTGKVYIKEALLDTVKNLEWPWFWSSTSKDSANAYKAYLNRGNISDYKKTSTCSVRCVRNTY